MLARKTFHNFLMLTVILIALFIPIQTAEVFEQADVVPKVLLVYPDMFFDVVANFGSFPVNPTELFTNWYVVQSWLIHSGISFDIKNESSLVPEDLMKYRAVIFVQKYISEHHYDTLLQGLQQYVASGGCVVQVIGGSKGHLGYYNDSWVFKGTAYRDFFNIGNDVTVKFSAEGIVIKFTVANNSHPVTSIWSVGDYLNTELEELRGYPSMYVSYIPIGYTVVNSSIQMWNLVAVVNETSGETLGYAVVVAQAPGEGPRITFVMQRSTAYSGKENFYPVGLWKVFTRIVWWCVYGDRPWIRFRLAPTVLATYRWDDLLKVDYIEDTLQWVEQLKIPITVYVTAGVASFGYANWTLNREVAESLYVEIGAHGVSHVRLDQVDFSTLIFELEKSREWIVGNLSIPIEEIVGWSYPYNYFNHSTNIYAARYYTYVHSARYVPFEFYGAEYINTLYAYHPVTLLRSQMGPGAGANTWYPHNASLMFMDTYGDELSYLSVLVHEDTPWNNPTFKESVEEFVDYVRNVWGWREVYDIEVAMRVRELVKNNFTVTYGSDYIKITMNKKLSYDYAVEILNTNKYIYSVTIDGKPWYAFNPTERRIILPKQFNEVVIRFSDTLPDVPVVKRASHEIVSTTYSDDVLGITINAPDDVNSLITIHTGCYDKPFYVKRTDTSLMLSEVTSLEEFKTKTNVWYYDSVNKILYIKTRHQSIASLEVSWFSGEEKEKAPPTEEEERLPWNLYLLVTSTIIVVIAFFYMWKATRHVVEDELLRRRKFVKKNAKKSSD